MDVAYCLFNNQTDALFIQIYSVKTLHVSGNFFAHHQEISTVLSALVSFMQVLMTASKHSQQQASLAHTRYCVYSS